MLCVIDTISISPLKTDIEFDSISKNFHLFNIFVHYTVVVNLTTYTTIQKFGVGKNVGF